MASAGGVRFSTLRRLLALGLRVARTVAVVVGSHVAPVIRPVARALDAIAAIPSDDFAEWRPTESIAVRYPPPPPPEPANLAALQAEIDSAHAAVEENPCRKNRRRLAMAEREMEEVAKSVL